MTEEEKKVKGYLKDICPICNDREACLQDGCNCYIEQAYLDGLAEGRKELEQWKQEWQDAQIKANEEGFSRTILQIKYTNLEKENAELNRDKTELVNSVTELKTKVTELEEKPKNNSYVQILQNEKAEMAEDFAKQIEKMKAETQIILEDHDTLSKWVDELREQIEEMKCCYNCKHGRIYFVNEIIVDCLANKVNSNNKFNNCDKWGLKK